MRNNIIKILLSVLVLLLWYGAYAQQAPSYIIALDAKESGKDSAWQIDIMRHPDTILIKYARFNSINSDAMKHYGYTQETMKSHFTNLKNEEERKEFVKKYGKIRDRYKIYIKDSLQFSPSNYKNFIQLFDQIANTSKEVWRNEKRRHEILLDGALVHLKVIQNDKITSNVYAQSPSEKYYPLLKNLIESALELLGKTK